MDCLSNSCSGSGECENSYCVCNNGWTDINCSTKVPNIPEIQSTIPSTQYSSWDKYGNDHPIFNVSTIAQIRLYLTDSSVDYLLDPANRYTSVYQHGDLHFTNEHFQTTIGNIGVRIKGGVSRSFAKKSFKV